ncbi:MAG: mechanosensitive ion channel [Caldilineaceae bacterium]|nr:mechanosensitive ion channel [Caldilineaceae bacterium]
MLHAQEATPPAKAPASANEETQAPDQVAVEPTAQDAQIAKRLTSILEATGWFANPMVAVRDGVVFLDGESGTKDQREWASNLARNTQDVVAVVNRIEVTPRSVWDFSPAAVELRSLWRSALLAIPFLIFGAIVLLFSWWLMELIARLLNRFFRTRTTSPLLASVAARTIAIPVFLLGLYLVLQVAGLTRLALTLLGGTGIVGIVLGFAFRDIAENFLASLLLSLRQPFDRDDLIEVADQTGIVQQMNTRSTVLMTLDGNHVQIPNAVIFKSTITNFTANPNRRSDFIIGIGYDDPILQAQQIIAAVLGEHPTVLQTPEPLVLVDQLAAATVNLRVYFWYDATQYAPIKIKSSLLRLIKRALQDAQISMPDEAREVIFPSGVPIIAMGQDSPQVLQPQQVTPARPQSSPRDGAAKQEPVSSSAEGDLRVDEQEMRAQAQQSRILEEGEDLLNTR